MKIDNGQQVANEHGIKERSPYWHHVQETYLHDNPKCAICGATEGIQVHHKNPFHYCISLGRPDLELDPRNLISLCESESGKPENNHHLLIGHLNDFKSSNLDIDTDVIKYHGMTLQEIKESTEWQQEELSKRLKPLNEMSDSEKQEYRKQLDTLLPCNIDLCSKYHIVL